MTTIAQPHGDPVLGTPSKLRVAIGSAVGTTVENYDFIGYSTAAALYFVTAFFPSTDPVTGTLLSFATLGIGFAARPIGGIVGGYLGDKIGRRPVEEKVSVSA
jgi:MFS family permease